MLENLKKDPKRPKLNSFLCQHFSHNLNHLLDAQGAGYL